VGAVVGHYDNCYEYDEEQRKRDVFMERYFQRRRDEIDKAFDTLGTNLEVVACLAAYGRNCYTKGFSDSELLKAFCEDYVPEPYFPMGDTRPTAERLGWRT
jgi:hypothetical protein